MINLKSAGAVFLAVTGTSLLFVQWFLPIPPDHIIGVHGILPGTVPGMILALLCGLLLALPPVWFLRHSPGRLALVGMTGLTGLIALPWPGLAPAPVRLFADGRFILYGVVVLALLNAHRWFRNKHRPGPSIRQVAITVFVLLMIWGVISTFLIKNSALIRQDEVTGDEPEYIMLALSLIRDHDFSLLADQQDLRCQEFMHGNFRLIGRDTLRAPGYPALLIPSYLAGRYLQFPGLPYTLFLFMQLIFALLGFELTHLLVSFTRKPVLAGCLALAAMSTMPMAVYGNQIYPEMVAALLVVRLFRRAVVAENGSPGWMDGFCLAILPWLHQKYQLLVAFMGIYLVIRLLKGRFKGWPGVVIPGVISAVGIVTFFMNKYGSPLPTAPYSVGTELFSRLGSTATLKGVLGHFLDQRWGIFMIAPVYLFAVPGLVVFFRRYRRIFLFWLPITALHILFMAAYQMWWGGFSPAGRFLLPIIPLLWIPIACLAGSGVFRRPAVLWTAAVLLTISLIFSGYTLMAPPYKHQDSSPFLYPEESPNGSSLYGSISHFIDWTALLPVIERGGRWNHILPEKFRGGIRDVRQTAVWMGLILCFTVWILISPRRKISVPLALIIWLGGSALGITVLEKISQPLSMDTRERIWMQKDLTRGYFSPLHHYRWQTEGSEPWVTYGPKIDEWLTATSPILGIYYPPVFDQDYPGTLWPGGYAYTLKCPLQLPDTAGEGSVHFQVENRISKQKKEQSVSVRNEEAQLNPTLTLQFEHPHEQQALFKVVLYGDKTADYRYRQVRLYPRKVP